MTTVQQNGQNSQEIQELQAILAALESESKEEGNSDPILAMLIKMITEILTSLEGGNSTPPQPASGSSFAPQPKVNPGAPTNSQMSNAIAQLAEALAELQVLLGKYGQEKQGMTNDNMQNMIEEAQAQIKQAQANLQKLEDQQSHHSFWDIFLKVVTAIVGAVFAAIACATGQVELAVVIIALTVAAETGAFGEATKLISDVLQAMNVPAKEANIIASVIVIVATIVVTIATCGAAAPEAAADVADIAAEDVGTEMTDFAGGASEEEAETLSTTTETTAEQSQSFANTLKNIGSKILEYNPFNKLSPATNMAVLTGSQALMGSNLVNNILAACPMSDKEREKLEKILGIITDIICSLASVGAGLGAAAGAGASASESVFSQSTMNKLMLVGLGAQASGSLGDFELADIDSKEAALEASLGNDNATASLFQNLSKMNESLLTSGNTSTTKTEAAHTEELTALLADLTKAGQALAQVLSA